MAKKIIQIKPQPGPQTAFLKSPHDIVLLGGANFGGKAQPLDAVVQTPFGERRMGEMKIGAQVLCPDGTVSRVIGIYPQPKQPIWQVKFKDGSSTRVTGDHLWLVRYAARHGIKADIEAPFWKGRLATTQALAEHMADERNHKRTPYIPLTRPVPLTVPPRHREEIDPYVLGLLLGDGCFRHTRGVSLTSSDDEIQKFVESVGFRAHDVVDRAPSFAAPAGIVHALKERKLFGLLSQEKFVPLQHRYANVDDRLALLQGLMDADGYVDERGHFEFSTVSWRLAEDVRWLVQSLGGTASIATKTPTYVHRGEQREGQLAYRLYIRMPFEVPPFRMTRKIDRCSERLEPRRFFESIEIVDEAPAQCIQIDHPAGLYLTDDFIVTHNTFALLMEATRYIFNTRGFGSVIFRRTTKEVRGEGGLWDTSMQLYPGMGGKARESDLEWRFRPHNNRISFAHLEHDSDRHSWQGAQVPMLGFDQAEAFTGTMFWHMFSRNRTTCGIRPYTRMTANPDPDCFLIPLIEWWLTPDGYPDMEKSGVPRWFVRAGDDLIWGESLEEARRNAVNAGVEEAETTLPTSFTFIPAMPDDNVIGMELDPGYISKLNALPRVERERLRKGNWKIRPAAGDYFQRAWCEMVDACPERVKRRVRAWDLASTKPSGQNPDPDWSVGVRMSRTEDDNVVIESAIRRRGTPGEIEQLVLRVAEEDGVGTEIFLAQDPGQAGKAQCEDLARKLSAYRVRYVRETGDKATRFGPFSSKAEHGGVKIVRGPWNGPYLDELENFPPQTRSGHDDDADATSSAYNFLFGKVKIGGTWGRAA